MRGEVNAHVWSFYVCVSTHTHTPTHPAPQTHTNIISSSPTHNMSLITKDNLGARDGDVEAALVRQEAHLVIVVWLVLLMYFVT